jgi:hypothetical protein
MPQPDNPSFHLRLTPALRKQIKLAAAQNERSINAEIQARLERSFVIDDADRVQALKLLTEVVSLLDKGRA